MQYSNTWNCVLEPREFFKGHTSYGNRVIVDAGGTQTQVYYISPTKLSYSQNQIGSGFKTAVLGIVKL